MSSTFSIQILGSSSAVPTRDRNQTALILDLGQESILFDAGEGVQKQFILFNVKPHKITHVIISHLHPDHFIGLIGMLCSWGLLGRHNSLTIVSPEGLREIIEVQLKHSRITLHYPLEWIHPSNENDSLVLETKRFVLRSYLLQHRVPCFGFKLTEAPHERRLLPEMLEGSSLPYEAYNLMKQGNDFTDESGKVHSHLDYTSEAPHARSFVYFTDTSVLFSQASFIEGSDVLYHDCTFMHDIAEKARDTGHSTSCEAAEFAREAKVNKLLLGHFSSRYGNLKVLENEARTIFKESYLATEGQIFEVNNKPL